MTQDSGHQTINPGRAAVDEALSLGHEILRHIELSEIPLHQIALKAMRFARLLNDFDLQQAFELEVSGYPSRPDGMPSHEWRLAKISGRVYQEKEKDEIKTYAYRNSIQELESDLALIPITLAATVDAEISISSANPQQYVHAPPRNSAERASLLRRATAAQEKIAQRRAFIYKYILSRVYDLKFSNIAGDVFQRYRSTVDEKLGNFIPDSVKKFDAVYENLKSDNPEDWSNAAHSCRRILQDLADALFPPREQSRSTKDGRAIKLGVENYINRLICFAEDKSESEVFYRIVGSHLSLLGDRLDALFSGAQKGSHAVLNRDEADRIVVLTYIVVGDFLELAKVEP